MKNLRFTKIHCLHRTQVKLNTNKEIRKRRWRVSRIYPDRLRVDQFISRALIELSCLTIGEMGTVLNSPFLFGDH